MNDEKIERLLQWARGKKAPPYTLDINPTDKCNLRCLHCWQRAFKNIDSSYELSDEDLVRVVDEAIKLGVMEFEITGGGEPLVRRNLVLKIMGMIKKNKRFGNITTNGTLITEDSAKKIVKMGWDRITFSIEGPDSKTNDYIRGKGSFERVMKSIKMVNRMKQKTKNKYPIIKFNVVVNRKNYNRVTDIVKLAKDVGCSMIHFDSLTVHSKLGKKLKLTKRQSELFEKYAKEAKALAEKYGIWTDVDKLTKSFIEKSNKMDEILKNEADPGDFSKIVCYEPWWHLVIKTNGYAQPCCLYDEKVDNVKNKSLKEIWFGPYFEKIREDMKNKKFSIYCSICNAGQVFENRRIRRLISEWMKK